MIRALFACLILLASLIPATPAGAASCQFVLGFKALHDLIPATVGDCLTDEYHNPDNGDALQKTKGGLLVWRKADNWTAFTDGYHTWVNGPRGLQERLNTERFPWEVGQSQNADVQAAVAQVNALGFDVFDTSTYNPAAQLHVLIGIATGSADGGVRSAFFFAGGYYRGTDYMPFPAIVSVAWQDDTTVALHYDLYRQHDHQCCPTGGSLLIRYQWDGHRVKSGDEVDREPG